MAQVLLENIQKSFDDTLVIPSLDLTIEDGEFVVLVGPSGCGKTTVLRLIAGLEGATGGTIMIDGRIVNDVEPKDRDIAMVFQNYALYPHMSVFDNMAFGLKMRKMAKAEIAEKVHQAAKQLQLEPYLDRKPRQLSGGQRQRVALGRAMVRQPKVFLMDEPLSNLDAKLRVQMRREILDLHHRIEGTTIYVTHDQVEALTMGDRIVVFNHGRIEQLGPPTQVYNQPSTLFVAGFIGPINQLSGTYSPDHHGVEVAFQGESMVWKLPGEPSMVKALAPYAGKEVVVAFRPEHCQWVSPTEEPTEGMFKLWATPSQVEHLGSEQLIHLDDTAAAMTMTAKLSPDILVKPGSVLPLQIPSTKAWVFDPQTQQRIDPVPALEPLLQ